MSAMNVLKTFDLKRRSPASLIASLRLPQGTKNTDKVRKTPGKSAKSVLSPHLDERMHVVDAWLPHVACQSLARLGEFVVRRR
jgi:hypothetical protein